jgi:hypothetical protein
MNAGVSLGRRRRFRRASAAALEPNEISPVGNNCSDIDIAIDISIGDHGAPDRLCIAAQLSAALGAEVDVLVLGDTGVPLLDEIVRDMSARVRQRAAADGVAHGFGGRQP